VVDRGSGAPFTPCRHSLGAHQQRCLPLRLHSLMPHYSQLCILYDQRRSAAAVATQQQQRQKNIMVGRSASSSSTAAATSLALLGLSVTFLRWWNNANNKHDHPLSALFPRSEGGGGERLKSLSKWWPIIAIQRWMERNSRINSTTIADDEEYSNNEVHNAVVEVVNHQGSCHCGSIKFQLHGPRKLRAIDYSSSSSSSSSQPISLRKKKMGRRRPVCFFSTSIPISADKFQLITGQECMRFYYEDDINNTTTSSNDSSSSITSDHQSPRREQEYYHGKNNNTTPNSNDNNEALGAHSFCSNCGVHVFYADRNSGRLEVNANCIIGQVGGDDGERVSITVTTTVMTPIVNNKTGLSYSLLNTKNEPLLALAGASFIESLDYDSANKNNSINNDLSNTDQCTSSSSNNNNKELSVTSTTDPESSYSTAIMMDGDDTSSMGSQSATSAYLSLYHTSQHVVPASPIATSHDRTTTTTAIMGAGPRIPSSNRSVKTLPPRLGGGIGTTTSGGGWSVTSSDDLLFNYDDDDDGDEEHTSISPRMRDRMMKYLKRHIDPIQED